VSVGAGMFQSDPAQFGCISCDKLGSFYQASPGQTSCSTCPVSTQRFIGVLSGATIDACQCKEGGFAFAEFVLSSSIRLSRDDVLAGSFTANGLPGVVTPAFLFLLADV
jgi:hypothetical protein